MNVSPKQYVIDMLWKQLEFIRTEWPKRGMDRGEFNTQCSVINEAIRWAERQPER